KSQFTVPSSGFNPTTRSVVMNTASGSAPVFPLTAKSTGEEVLAGSSSAFHWSSPDSLSNAATELPLPFTATSTRLPTTSGEQQTPKRGSCAFNTLKVSTCQSCLPLSVAKHVKTPVMPNENTRSPTTAGVACGPVLRTLLYGARS